MNTLQQNILAQTQKKGRQSKKFVFASASVFCLMLVWAVSVSVTYLKPEIATSVVSLAGSVLPILGTIAVTLIGGQAYYEGKAMTTITEATQTTNENKRVVLEETVHIIQQGDPDAPLVRPFSQNATSLHS